MTEEERLRKELGNYRYFKQKYKTWFSKAKSNDERRLIKREIFSNKLLKQSQKEEIWHYITKDFLK